MFQISPEQLAILASYSQDNYYQRCMGSLRETMPTETARLADAELLALIKDCARDAALYGIVSRRGVFQYAILRLLCGPKFDERPAISHYLNLSSLDPDVKIESLLDSALDALQKKQ